MGQLKKVIKYHSNGKIYEEFTENECGDKFGEYKEYDLNGKLIALHFYDDNVMKKHCIDFYENGEKEYETIYYGSDISFHTFINYYENGQIKTSSDKIDDDFHGPYLEFYEDGTKKEETTYNNFYKIGLSKKWHPNGQLESEEEYGPYEKLNGFKRTFNYKGELIKEEFYVNGVLHKK